jgi:hypothetical protein
MKKVLFPVLLMLLAGCDFDVPLSRTASAPANPALAGSWVQKAAQETFTMNIRTSGTDYAVTYGEVGETPLTFKGFTVEAADLKLIQLELTDSGITKYLFVKYEMTPDRLSVYRLNKQVVSALCRTSEELLNDIALHKNNPALFEEPIQFTRSVPQ